MSAETVYSLFSSAVDDAADRPFLWFEGRSTTYAEADLAVDRYATVLADRGVGAGDRVGVLAANAPEFVSLLLATAKLGATFVPLDYRQEGDVLSYLLSDATPTALVVGERAHDAFAAVADDVDADVGTTLTLGIESAPPERSLRAIADATDPDPTVGGDPGPADVAVVNYTSGSTGPPKGVGNPHRAFVEAGRRMADRCGTDADDRALVVLPLFHANPQTYALMQVLAVGGSLALVESFSASGFWETARRSDSTYFTHVGSVLEILSRSMDDGVDTDTPLEFTVGGAAQFDDRAAFEAETGIQVVRLYGLSEVGAGVVTCNRRREGTVHGVDHQGPVESAPFDVAILDPSGTELLDPGERGEIVVRPDRPGTMFAGYLDKHRETVAAWRDLWMHTGDLGYVDDAGNLHYVGRLKTSIRTGGENVSPWEIETVVDGFPEVTESVAVGVDDPVAGEAIKLYVVPADDGATEPAIHERCHEALPDHLLPRYVELLSELPRTSTQKVRRVALRDRGVGDAWDGRDGSR
jgi:crotonobetaine/carnitine-CoA ligase